jgi:hypothetical protein
MSGMPRRRFTISVRAVVAARIEFLTLKIPQQRKKVKREKMNNKKRLHSGAGAKAG